MERDIFEEIRKKINENIYSTRSKFANGNVVLRGHREFYLAAESIAMNQRRVSDLRKKNISRGEDVSKFIHGFNSDNFLCVAIYSAMQCCEDDIEHSH